MLRRYTKLLKSALVIAAAGTSFLVTQSASAQPGYSLDASSIVTVNKVTCGFLNNKWVPGSKLKSGFFLPISEKIAALNVVIKNKKTSAAKKSSLKAQVVALKRKLKLGKICSTLSSGGFNTPAPVPGGSTPATPLPGATTAIWSDNATLLLNNVGGEYLYFCPANPNGAFNAIYGSDVYTTDSPICVAAVHAGLFLRGTGGNVKFKILTGQSFYNGGVRNAIVSNFYGNFESSYVFVNIDSGVELRSSSPVTIPWSMSAKEDLNSYTEQQFTFICPAGGVTDTVWGTGLYTSDSSICTAAVHSGRATVKNGGTITVQIKPGASSYTGSTRFGITSNSYGSWDGSFIFIP